jgi:hypothetical protein
MVVVDDDSGENSLYSNAITTNTMSKYSEISHSRALLN